MDINRDQKIGCENKGDGEMEKHSNDDTKRVCNYCEKVFRSGKALGGHMRIHVQRSDIPLSNKKLKLDHTAAHVSDNYMVRKPTCTICGKNFPSWKSLYGHMRCHPGRDWRGVTPPSTNTTCSYSSSSVSDDNNHDQKNRAPVVDLTASLWGWSMTAARGRKATTASSSVSSEVSSSEIMDVEFRNAVNYLLMLSKGVFHGESVNQSKRDDDDQMDDSKTNNNSLMKNKKKKKKKVRLSDLKLVKNGDCPLIDKDYRCNKCNKSFPSHQALGGHRSSHNKFKIVIHNSNDDDRLNSNPTTHHQMEATDHYMHEQRGFEFDLNDVPPLSEDDDEAGFQSETFTR